VEGAEYHMNKCPTCGCIVPHDRGMVYKNDTFCDAECVADSIESTPFVNLGTQEKEPHEERIAA
jgi:hypothetical protein